MCFEGKTELHKNQHLAKHQRWKAVPDVPGATPSRSKSSEELMDAHEIKLPHGASKTGTLIPIQLEIETLEIR